jgi:hypothetical protein
VCWCLKVCAKINWISFFKAPSAFSSKEKAGKKKGTSAPATVFQGPLRPKKQTWFFFLDKMRAKKKEPKKKPLENFLIQNTAKKKIRWLLNYCASASWRRSPERKRQGTLVADRIFPHPGAAPAVTSCSVSFPAPVH